MRGEIGILDGGRIGRFYLSLASIEIGRLFSPPRPSRNGQDLHGGCEHLEHAPEDDLESRFRC